MVSKSFSSFVPLTTANFLLRQLTLSDQNEIFVLRSDQRVLEYLDIPAAKSLDDAIKFINKINCGDLNNEWAYWAISFKGEQKLIGTICLWNICGDKTSADIGFTLLPEFQGKGIMQEVIPVVLSHGFYEMNLGKILGEVSPGNIKSIKLLEKFGFICTDEFEHTSIYTLTRN